MQLLLQLLIRRPDSPPTKAWVLLHDAEGGRFGVWILRVRDPRDVEYQLVVVYHDVAVGELVQIAQVQRFLQLCEIICPFTLHLRNFLPPEFEFALRHHQLAWTMNQPRPRAR